MHFYQSITNEFAIKSPKLSHSALTDSKYLDTEFTTATFIYTTV